MKKKALLFVLAAALIVVASVGGTLAWLKSSDTVTNTFTVGNVTIDLWEHPLTGDGKTINTDGEHTEANTYHIVPGVTYQKDPTVTVVAGSEKCYVFVKVTNPLGAGVTPNIVETTWIPVTTGLSLEDGEKVYMYSTPVTGGTDLPVFTEVSVSHDLTTIPAGQIVVTAYAIQKEGLDTSLTNAQIFALASAA